MLVIGVAGDMSHGKRKSETRVVMGRINYPPPRAIAGHRTVFDRPACGNGIQFARKGVGEQQSVQLDQLTTIRIAMNEIPGCCA